MSTFSSRIRNKKSPGDIFNRRVRNPTLVFHPDIVLPGRKTEKSRMDCRQVLVVAVAAAALQVLLVVVEDGYGPSDYDAAAAAAAVGVDAAAAADRHLEHGLMEPADDDGVKSAVIWALGKYCHFLSAH